jgi:hypothetical protein
MYLQEILPTQNSVLYFSCFTMIFSFFQRWYLKKYSQTVRSAWV